MEWNDEIFGVLFGRMDQGIFLLDDVTDFLFSTFSFFSDLVDGQKWARPQFQGRFFLLEFGLASEWENERRRWRNRRRKKIKEKFDNRLVSDVI